MCVCYLTACVEPIVEKTVIIKGADMDRAGQPRPEDDHVASGMRKQINPACFVCEHVNKQGGS